MSNQNTPRNINFSNARGGSQPGQGGDNSAQPQRTAASAPNQQRRAPYGQAADAQRYQGAAQGQVRRTAPPQPTRPGAHAAAAQQQAYRAQTAAQQQYTRSASQQRQAMAQQSGAVYEEFTIDRTRRPQEPVSRMSAGAARPASASMPQRQINTQRAAAAQPQRRSAGGAGAAMPQGRQPYRPGANSLGGAAGGRGGNVGWGGNGGNGGRGAAARDNADAPESLAAVRKRKRLKAINRALTAMCASFAVFLVCYVGLRVYASTIINTGEGGITSKEYRTPPQYAGDQLNVLLLGIDYTAEDGQGRSPNGLTDMIMYVRFNFKDNTIRMLQIPRDLFVGPEESTGGTGKINALYASGEDKTNRVSNIAKILSEQYQLPVDNYVSIDMDSLREIIDLFGGIDVYVTEDMEFAGSYIPQGLQHLDGAASEFFLRNRKQYATSDMRRLENQRYFYSALFKLVRTSPWQEIVKLVPVVRNYVNTDIDPVDCAALGIKMLKIPSSQILIARLPVAGAAEKYNGQSIIVCSVPETTELLNQYFRAEDQQVSAELLNIAQLPVAGGVHPSNVQWMSDIDTDGGGTAGEAADATQTGDDVLQEASSASQSTAPAA